MAASCCNCDKRVTVGKILCGDCVETLEMSGDKILTEERAGERLVKAFKEGRILVLPAPIGSEVFVPYIYEGDGGAVESIVEKQTLAGYINEGGREFYITGTRKKSGGSKSRFAEQNTEYDDTRCSSDIEPENLFTNREDAEARLAEMLKEPTHV